MRKRFRVLILAAVAAAVAVPVGLALTLKSPADHGSPLPTAVVPAIPSAVVAATVTSAFGHSEGNRQLPGVPDSAKLFGMGAVLLGLAAGVKRTFPGHSHGMIAAPEAYNRDESAR
jgi:hypothetical protein